MIRPRAHVDALAPVYHGSISDAELAGLGFRRDQVIDFSVNSNPLGPSPAAIAAVQAATWSHYPDDRATVLRGELACREGRGVEQVIVANGSSELIWLLATAFIDPGQSAVVVGPTFGEYARAVRIAGGVIHEHRATPEDQFTVDFVAIEALARDRRARIVFICNPNNPTGVLASIADIEALALKLPESLIVVDEAYRPFVDEPRSSLPLTELDNIVLLRSLTKDYALAGLRLGYALAASAVVDALDKVRPPWSVNVIAQIAGLAALGDEEHLRRGRDEVRRARAYVTEALSALELRVLPSAANYVLLDVGDAGMARSALLRHGIVVRDCTSFGLPNFIRVGLRTVQECERLVAACEAADLASIGAPQCGAVSGP